MRSRFEQGAPAPVRARRAPRAPRTSGASGALVRRRIPFTPHPPPHPTPPGRYVVFGAGALTPPPGASLARDLRLLWPPNLLAAARLLFAWATRPKLDVLNLPGQNKAALGFNLIWLYERVDDILSDLFDEIEDLDLPPPHVGARVPWAQLPAALGALQGGGTVGKVVVTLGGDG